MYTFRDYAYSRTVVLGTAVVATIFELAAGIVFIALKRAIIQELETDEKYRIAGKKSEYDLVGETNGNKNNETVLTDISPSVISSIEKECGKELAKAVISMTGNRLRDKTAVLSTTSVFNIISLPLEKYDYIINLHKINDISQPDDFFDAVCSKLDINGYFFCCVETKDQRKARLLKKYPPVLNYIYYFFDFIVKRVLPKLKATRKLYLFLTRGSNVVMSRAEALGRISRAGFRIKQESFIGNKLCIEGRKTGAPVQKNENNYGALIALPRIGKGGEIIKVYKLRTMHPYSEYIQDYIYRLHDLQNGGKFKDDFRITSWGAVCRKIWLDELPSLFNLINGDLKLVGIRPLSRQYFELYSPDHQQRRIKYKPGIIPPFYADMPGNLEEIQASEKKYLDSYDKNHLITDLRYLFKSIWNIAFKKARSN
jgi:lipopolysaccharide/colanic/teichoic acid biosynthesis glycosyltransferase